MKYLCNIVSKKQKHYLIKMSWFRKKKKKKIVRQKVSLDKIMIVLICIDVCPSRCLDILA